MASSCRILKLLQSTVDARFSGADAR